LGRKAEKEGKYSAAIAAEVNRGRVAGLYARDEGTKDVKALESLSNIDKRINELLEIEHTKEREVRGKVISDVPAAPKRGK
jgi:hypothetical protein